ncbi:hypothetical protein DFJ73DRAFT_240103 [Zopfochytrium polystomum]|nr:hypothetical protein DFJ73DRAFT_240103 [Zopfochytrium polystomum]
MAQTRGSQPWAPPPIQAIPVDDSHRSQPIANAPNLPQCMPSAATVPARASLHDESTARGLDHPIQPTQQPHLDRTSPLQMSSPSSNTGPPQPPHPIFPMKKGLSRRWSCETCRRRKLKCDGARPTCSFCSLRKFDCVFIGTTTREEHEMGRQRKEKDSTTRGLNSPYVPFSVQFREGTGRQGLSAVDRMIWRSAHNIWSISTPELFGELENHFETRPNAPDGEELVLIDAFFTQKPTVSGIIHKRSYLRNYKTMPAYLRLAVCAAGASSIRSQAPRDEAIRWYFHRAIQLLHIAFRKPRLECLQALMILPVTEQKADQKLSSSLLESGASMALWLGLNVDPDYLPSYSTLSWLEKEVRRRCWWYFFIGDHIVSSVSNTQPTLSRAVSSVKPICPERLWASPKPSDKLQLDYDSPIMKYANPLNWHVKLLEIFHKTSVACRIAELDLISDSNELDKVEQELEAALIAWWQIIPSSFWTVAAEDSLFELMEEDSYCWQNMVELFFGYHGCMCLIMRRKAVIYIHHRSTSSSVAKAESPVDEPSRYRAAFNSAVSSALAIAHFAGLLRKTNAFLHRVPYFSVYFGSLAAVFLLSVEPTFKELSGIAVGEQTTPKSNDITAAIDELLSFFRIMSAGRAVARSMHDFLLRARRGEWDFLQRIDQDPFSLLLAISEQTLASASVEASVFPVHNFLHAVRDLNKIPGTVRWEQLIEGFENIIRQFIRTLREARSGCLNTPVGIAVRPDRMRAVSSEVEHSFPELDALLRHSIHPPSCS